MKRKLRDINKEMESIKIRERWTSSDLEETKLYLLDSLSKLEVMESEMRSACWRDIGKNMRADQSMGTAVIGATGFIVQRMG